MDFLVDPVDLEDVPSEFFDDVDVFFESEARQLESEDRSLSDYSEWPAETSSPAPEDLEQAEGDGTEYEASEIEYELEFDPEYEGQDGEEFEGQDGEEFEEEGDPESEEEAGQDSEGYGEEENYLQESDRESNGGWGPDSVSEDGLPPQSYRSSRSQSRTSLFDNPHRLYRLSESPSDSLFVDEGPISLPGIDSVLSSLEVLRRNDIPVIDLASDFGTPRAEPSHHDPARRRGVARPLWENRNRENNRHHPYNSSTRAPSRERGWMADMADLSAHRNNNNNNSNSIRDELVAVEVQEARTAARSDRMPARAAAEVIDLTNEPDSPELPRATLTGARSRMRASNPPQNPRSHPRRQMSLSQRTPSLSRSDGSFLGNNASVIDLTLDDSPVPVPRPQPLPTRRTRHRPSNPPPVMSRSRPIEVEVEEVEDDDEPYGATAVFGHYRRIDDRPGFIDLLNRLQGRIQDHIQGFIGRYHPEADVEFIGRMDVDNPLAENVPNLNYRANGQPAFFRADGTMRTVGGGAGAPKPPHVPPPRPREGFTRCTGGDDVAVCPSCEEELQYDPDAEDANAPPAKKARTRKDREEHYFWAVKECGHVYCKQCYEHRAKAGGKNSSAYFRRAGENNRKILCAVDDCPSEVNSKAAWIGLFL
ncbi:hypothetical protein VTK56DRAFT_5887 [Thermocarpiscus australiensis]